MKKIPKIPEKKYVDPQFHSDGEPIEDFPMSIPLDEDMIPIPDEDRTTKSTTGTKSTSIPPEKGCTV